MENVIKDTHIKYIKKQITDILYSLEFLDKYISLIGVQNEQFILDFYDKLNEISIRK